MRHQLRINSNGKGCWAMNGSITFAMPFDPEPGQVIILCGQKNVNETYIYQGKIWHRMWQP